MATRLSSLPCLDTGRLSVQRCMWSGNSRAIISPVARTRRGFTTGTHDFRYDPRVFRVSEEVRNAVASGNPVVALESTIYTHGFPYPDNVSLASDLEDIIRQNGGVPATIGLLHGVARVGLDAEELVELASSAGKAETMKVSRRDLAYIAGLGLAGRKLNGGTTISGTMILAKMAGIEVFGTGGLGGVHRGGENTMDISADLTELGRTGVAVISSGCKSFLDLPRTLEYLETQGATVATFADGRTGAIDIPSFYSRDSGIRSPTVVQNEAEAAAMIYARRLLNVESGLLFANPIPEKFQIPYAEMAEVIDAAVREAAEKGYHGHRNTPFILDKIKELTKGNSIPANQALIKSNVKRATKVAVELSKISSSSSPMPNNYMPYMQSDLFPDPEVEEEIASDLDTTAQAVKTASTESSKPEAGNRVSRKSPSMQGYPINGVKPFHPEKGAVFHAPDNAQPTPAKIEVIVAGSVAVDLCCDFVSLTPSVLSPTPQTSNPASIQQSIGGVGHNVATAAHLVLGGDSVALYSIISKDLSGQAIMANMDLRGMRRDRLIIASPDEGLRTAKYVAVNDGNKDLVIAMADMDILASPKLDISTWIKDLEADAPRSLVIDANWHWEIIYKIIREGKRIGASIAFEPVSIAKSARLFPSIPQWTTAFAGDGTKRSENQLSPVFPDHLIDITTPNSYEIIAMHRVAKENGYFDSREWWAVIDALGIPSSGARVPMTMCTSAELVDEGIPQRVVQLLPLIPTIITKLGAEGVLVTKIIGPEDPALTDRAQAPYILSRSAATHPDHPTIGGIYMRLYPAVEILAPGEIVSVNGAGDTFLGVLIALLARGGDVTDEKVINAAQKAAVLTLKSKEAVSPEIGHAIKVGESLP